MHYPTLVHLLSLAVAVSAASQIHNANPGFADAKMQGCVSVKLGSDSNGVPVTINNCNNGNMGDFSIQYDWDVSFFDSPTNPQAPQYIKVAGDMCLEVKDGADLDGSAVQIATCDNTKSNPNQQWTSYPDYTFRWAKSGNKCLDLRDGQVAKGTPLVISTCSGRRSSTQAWASSSFQADEGVYLFVSGSVYCMLASVNNANIPASVAECVGADPKQTFRDGSLTWNVPSAPFTGPISTFGDKCLTVSGPILSLELCTGASNQRFRSLPSGQLEWDHTGSCVSMSDRFLRLSECSDASDQKWTRTHGA
ncbi:hypothetical protein MIND_00977000 [Mycena indigotica]|uniref:Ig-like domain-containing protein n=1 Tax=Mycena indigotica TaxID=2126181 RepID=A0A8H6VX88_9AGAR|nr:uncharacterized protein MIND_00977000 [Mycena indigotica]KAF7297434.1 hypothetical protein MIND_00977000 [Mycena indigotica]